MNSLYAARLLAQGARSRRSEVVLGALNLLCLIGVVFIFAVLVLGDTGRRVSASLEFTGSPLQAPSQTDMIQVASMTFP